DTRVSALDQRALRDGDGAGTREHAAAALDRWVSALVGGLVDGRAPRSDVQLVPGEPVALAEGQTARPRQGVVWVRLAGGDARFLGEEPLAAALGAVAFPLAEDRKSVV